MPEYLLKIIFFIVCFVIVFLFHCMKSSAEEKKKQEQADLIRLKKEKEEANKVTCPGCGKRVNSGRLRTCAACRKYKGCIHCCGYSKYHNRCYDCYCTRRTEQCDVCKEYIPESELVVCRMCDREVCKKCSYDDYFCSSLCESTYH